MACNTENQLNPTFGNVVFLHIELTRYSVPFPTDLADEVEVNLISRTLTRIPIPSEKVTINEDGSVDVEISEVPNIGEYSVEIKGSYGGYAWRCVAAWCLNYTFPTIQGGTTSSVSGDTYDISMEVQMNAPNAAQDAAVVAHNENTAAHPYILGLINDINASFANYYTKSQNYSKSEVDALLQALHQFTYQVVDERPEASADTMYKIYLVPYTVNENVVMREFITIYENDEYRWETIGDTTIALADYSTTAQMNTAINNALASYYTQLQTNLLLSEKASTASVAGYTAGSTVRVTGASGVVVEGNGGVSGTNYSAVNITSAGVQFLGQTLKWNNLNIATQADIGVALEGAVNAGGYNNTTHNIELKHGSTVLATIDATPFIKDGMLSSVTVSNGNLVLTFNTDAGGESITLPISDIFDADDYYTKTQVYTKTETNTAISTATAGVVYSSPSGSASTVSFDPQADTVHIIEQSLSSAQQLQARTNIGAGTSSFSGSYSDLTNKPTIPDAVSGTNDGTNWTSLTIGSTTKAIPSGGGGDVSGKADKVASATSGDFAALDSNGNLTDSGHKHSDYQTVIDSSHKLSADLIEDGTTNKVINVKPDWNAASGNAAEILNKPTIPAAQVQSDWNATTGMGVILNKPTIPTNCVTSTDITSIVKMTEAAYALITPNANTLYILTSS